MDPCLNPITFYPNFHLLFWGKKGNFEVYHDGDFFDLPYDYKSVMHYSGKEFYCCFNYSIFYLTYPISTQGGLGASVSQLSVSPLRRGTLPCKRYYFDYLPSSLVISTLDFEGYRKIKDSE